MNAPNKTEAEVVADLAKRSALEPTVLKLDEYDPGEIVLVPQGMSPVSVESLIEPRLDRPRRLVETSTHQSVPSFVAHVNRFSTPISAVFADIQEAKITAIYDYTAPPEQDAVIHPVLPSGFPEEVKGAFSAIAEPIKLEPVSTPRLEAAPKAARAPRRSRGAPPPDRRPVAPRVARPVSLASVAGRVVDGALVVTLPIRLVSEANAHEHWRVRQRRAKAQRELAAMLLANAFGRPPAPPLVVTITRIAPCALDSDNAVGSAKSVRDGVADFLGVNDRSPLVTWVVEQERGEPRTYGARVEVRSQ